MKSLHPISFYGMFIFDGNGDIVFSERFKLVEQRNKDSNIKVPNNSELAQFIKSDVIPYIANNSNAANTSFHMDFKISEGIYLVILAVKNLYLSLIPQIEFKSDQTHPIIEISCSYSLLSFLDSITSAGLKSLSGNSSPSSFSHIRQLIIQVMPFGTPVIHDTQFALSIASSGDINRFSGGYSTVASNIVPSWKTSLLFPHPKLELKLRETLLASINGPSSENTYEIYGELRCTSSIQYLPDITIVINNFESVQNISSHFCVKSIDENKITFSPPSGSSQLIHYKAKLPSSMDKLPIDGVYKIKEGNDGLDFSLTINAHMAFKKLTIQLPFPYRGNIKSKQFQCPSGTLRMSKNEPTIMWVLDKKAVSEMENASFTLTGNLAFEKSFDSHDKYFVFASFDNKESTFSGVSIDKDSLNSNSSQNLNLTVESSYSTENKKYIIWESPSD